MKSTLEKRILIFVFLVLGMTIAVNTALNIEGFRRAYRDSLVLRCQSIATELKSSIEKVLALGLSIEELDDINARCQEIVGADPEITYCLIENKVGQPLYSSEPSFYFFAGVQFIKSFNETTALLLIPKWGRVFDFSLPVFDAGGHLSGRIRIGFPDSLLADRAEKAYQRSIIIFGMAFLLVLGLIFVFTRRDLVVPIHRLCDMAQEIAGGNFKVIVPPMSTPEFSELGRVLHHMASSLHQRDEEITESYRELEYTNRELQLSYEHQEQISVELGRSREMYRSLLEDASDAILVSDDEDRLVLLNKAAEEFFGVSRDMIYGNNIFTFWEKLNCEDIEKQYELHRNILYGNAHEEEVRFTRPTDIERLIGWAKGSPVVGRDGKRMVQMTFRDVTREREIKENLEKSTEELQRLNQMKDSFLGIASHELKTPLTVILGYTDLLLDEMADQMDEEALNLLKHISVSAHRLSNIVRDMVDVSRLDNRRLKLRSRQVNVNQLIHQALKEIELFFSVRHQTHRLVLDEYLPDIFCDPDRMVQVITNLVINSIKFTPDGGKVTISTRSYQSCRIVTNGDVDKDTNLLPIGPDFYPYVEITISDTGIGIDRKDQIHIFDKFYEVGIFEEHFTDKVAFKGKGTGLGLTIVKGIIDMHGGEVWVESPGCNPEINPGSTFHILLPIFYLDSPRTNSSQVG